MGATTGRFTVSLTNITAEFLRKADACEEGVAWYRAHPEIHDWPWEVVCAALEEDGQDEWSGWVRWAVARLGSAEDRTALRDDPDAWVREAVARYGSAEDRAALRDDPGVWVRWAVARFGTAEDRATLRNDTHWLVRWTVAEYGRSGPK